MCIRDRFQVTPETDGTLYAFETYSVEEFVDDYGPDSEVGEDVHAGEISEDATELEFSYGFAVVNSHIDEAGDTDVFSFTAPSDSVYVSGFLMGELEPAEETDDLMLVIGGMDAGLNVELQDADGEVVGTSDMLGYIGADVTEGEQYFLVVTASDPNGSGNYYLDVFSEDFSEDENEDGQGEDENRDEGDDNDGDNFIEGEWDDWEYVSDVTVEILNAEGEVISDGEDWGEVKANVTADETYYVRITGADDEFTGEFAAGLFLDTEENEDAEQEDEETEVVVSVPEVESGEAVTVVVKCRQVLTKVGDEIVEKTKLGDADMLRIEGSELSDDFTVRIKEVKSEVLSMVQIDGLEGADVIDVIAKKGMFDGSVYLNGQDGGDKLIGKNTELPIEFDGGNGDDKLIGGRAADVLIGGEGDDLLKGMAGHDEMSGGDGVDELRGGRGRDTLSLSLIHI